jgi:hypothetical protein
MTWGSESPGHRHPRGTWPASQEAHALGDERVTAKFVGRYLPTIRSYVAAAAAEIAAKRRAEAPVSPERRWTQGGGAGSHFSGSSPPPPPPGLPPI